MDVMIVVGRERRLYYIVTQTVCLYLVVLLDTLLPRVVTQEKERKVAAKFKLVSTMIETGSGVPLQPTKISRDTITERYFPNKTLQLPV